MYVEFARVEVEAVIVEGVISMLEDVARGTCTFSVIVDTIAEGVEVVIVAGTSCLAPSLVV